MSKELKNTQEVSSRKMLLPYFIYLIIGCLLLQTFISFNDHEISLASNILLALVALSSALFIIPNKTKLNKIRFGYLVLSLGTFVIVNGSYHLHAYYLAVIKSPALVGGADYLPINNYWFGLIFGMPGFWALGLIVHIIASVALRGFEERR